LNALPKKAFFGEYHSPSLQKEGKYSCWCAFLQVEGEKSQSTCEEIDEFSVNDL
jgi:hypothetical protein